MIGAKFNGSEATIALDLTAKRATKLKSAFRTLAKPLRKDQSDHAAQKAGSRGKWPQLAKGTLRNRRSARAQIKAAKTAPQATTKRASRRRNPPRKLLGRLPRAIKTTVGDLFIRMESLVPFSMVHQKGGRVGKRALLPAREFLWISKAAHKNAAKMLAEHIARRFGKR